ncbi:endospore germination permease [Virgibacillus sp. SK37]|uniref:GerAB/ArcD/ProY family transporter n=1 Tax=Virgibacillus sp. SK37 TaxID=403957 RepID=UPI0004D19AFD|nr:endospore germination permease [Virgibacillus sp. SK37]AIF42431.1 spore germination protein GerLB [Virgibacillus sp. SK37]
MKDFKYADEKISHREIMISVPAVAIAVGILIVPSSIASVTVSSDGWVSLLAAGMISIFIAWLIARLAAHFPQQSFFSYASSLVSKPGAIILCLLFAANGILITAYEVKQLANTSHQYLFDRTPEEVVGLAFLLIVIYAVSGSRAGLIRLNIMFFPIIFAISFLLIIFSLKLVKLDNVLPVFQTDLNGYLLGFKESMFIYVGYCMLFFYTAFVRKPEKAPKAAALGMSMAVALYMLLFLCCVFVFGNLATANLVVPTIELAKTVEIPGGFFERFELPLFTIWVMAIFNTAAILLDISVLAISYVFPNLQKKKILFILSPLVFFISELPKNIKEISQLATAISLYSVLLSVSTVVLLFVMVKLKGVGKHAKK